MRSLIYLAAAIPFIIIVVVVVILATVRYSITDVSIKLSILGIPIRKIPLADIDAVEYFPADSRKSWSLLHQGGTVVVMTHAGGKTFAIMPRDAEGFYGDVRDAVFRRTGRRV
jgi:hypothetical protein